MELAARALFLQIDSDSIAEGAVSFFHIENNAELPWPVIAKKLVDRFPSISPVPLKAWLEIAHNQDYAVSEYLDTLEKIIFISRPPKLQVANAITSVKDLLHYMIDDDLLSLYIQFICTS